jgi:dethiobiotin synthetase
MSGRLVIVSGTGTNIGKTHVSEALLRVANRTLPRVLGIKPVETGLEQAHLSDSARLERASSFHVEQTGYLFAPPVSPHLAAREAGQVIELETIRAMVERTRPAADLTLVELPGGLFTPLSESLLNIDVVRSLGADFVLIVAPDRLGVLHDVLAAARGARAKGVAFDAIVLVAQELADESTHRNCYELSLFIHDCPIYEVPRAPVADLVHHPVLVELAREMAGPS